MATPSLRLGWIGLGSMGNAMAKNIHTYLQSRRGTSLCFYNRTPSRGDALEALGGERCASVPELAARSDVIFISASDDAAVQSIVEQIISCGSELATKIIVDTTTIHPNTTRQITESLAAQGAQFAATPVFGATPVAEQGRLLVAFAGPESVYQTIAPFLKGVIAREVLQVGKEPEKATLLKTTGNFMMAGLMEIIAEAHVFAEKTGLGADVLERLLELNFGTVAHSDSVRMTTGVYMPGKGEAPWSDLNLALKDVGHGVDSAKQVGVSLKVGNTVLEHLKRAKAYSDENGQRPLDSSSLYGVVRQDSGLDFRTEYVKKRDQ
ncbi:NAD binding domain of 6-phosphogluconate dehydrogenase-domain-containing protein [Xylaria bambusicola]|uniref:NAD binding domain of 6-phosphogluconate dehydrogenase-domain-containing protein n=1 Tax=Xylaria bambusicola TaxID=326684 RepID=UPI002007CB07|nr:NAD binding domain of 6-phosphogluconate dehydrogenase-domain-containing protein [Xylaria bambusicola]KAI0522144.1 NAD binding domain of 6-phosphogluconate dehydrogenase-domain-containing protein [Xylaria bambusicola]